jgi:hypothetical protein
MAAVCALGFLSALFAIVVGFFPPDQLPIDNRFEYMALLAGGVVLFSSIPLLLFFIRKRR